MSRSERIRRQGLVAWTGCVLLLLGVVSALPGQSVDQGSLPSGPRSWQVRYAAPLGTAGVDEFIGGGRHREVLVVGGNAWGPDSPATGAVWGRGAYVVSDPIIGGTEPFLSRQRAGGSRSVRGAEASGAYDIPLSLNNPMRSGFLLALEGPDLAVRSSVRFDWGVASIDALSVGDTGLFIAGKVGRGFSTWCDDEGITAARIGLPDLRRFGADRFGYFRNPEDQRRWRNAWQSKLQSSFGERYFDGQAYPGDVYVARIDERFRPVWVTVLLGRRSVQHLGLTAQGELVCASQGCSILDPDTGKELRASPSLLARTDQLDPRRAGWFRFGLGEKGSQIGRPDRNALLALLDAEAREQWAAWSWDANLGKLSAVGLAGECVVQDVCVTKRGEILCAVATSSADCAVTRHPFNPLLGPDRRIAFGSGVGGKSRNNGRSAQATYLCAFDPADLSYSTCTLFSAGDGSGHISADRIWSLADGSIAVSGIAQGDLLETEHRLFRKRRDPSAADRFIAVFDADLSELLFASYLSGLEVAQVASWEQGLVLMGRCRQSQPGLRVSDRLPKVGSERAYAGGFYDGFLLTVQGGRQ